MSVKNLLDPIIEQGIKNTNFFEGRLLAGQDMRDQQEANREHDRYLGRAIGQGIIEGLEVELDEEHDGSDGNPPVVIVKSGLAINAEGDVFGLPENDITLALSRSVDAPKIDIADFYACAGPPGHQHLPNGVGIYILVMSPTSGYREKALKSGLGDEGVAKGCGSKYVQEGVQFRLVEVSIDALTAVDGLSDETRNELKNNYLDDVNPVSRKQEDIARMSKLRNILAHICFGTEWVLNKDNCKSKRDDIEVNQDIRSVLGSLGIITNCDVVLSLMYWTLEGIAFIDLWSVRRVLDKNIKNGYFLPCSNSFSSNEMSAMQMQFNDHVEFLLSESKKYPEVSNYYLSDLFKHVPPVGVLPAIGGGSKYGFNIDKTFDGMSTGSTTVLSEDDVEKLLFRCRELRPVVVSKTDYMQLYWNKVNLQNVNAGLTSQLYVVFSSRDSHYFTDEDIVVRTLKQAWSSYKGLLQANAVLPKSITNDSLPVWLAIHTVLQSIMQYSIAESVTASSGNLTRKQMQQVFSAMYSYQKELTAVLEYRFEGDENYDVRHALVIELLRHLDGTGLPAGQPVLETSVTDNDIWGMLGAQNAINHVVSQWSGDIVIGFINMQHRASPDGDVLVPDGGDFVFLYALQAFTDRRATFSLNAGMFETTGGAWGDAVIIRDADSGAEINEITLNSLQEKLIEIVVTPPTGATVGTTAVLRLTAIIPAPTDHSWLIERTLDIGDTGGEPVNWSITPALSFMTPGRLNATPGDEYQFLIDTSYSTSLADLPASSVFTLNLNFSDDAELSQWDISIVGQPAARIDDHTFRYTRELNNGEVEHTDIRVVAAARGAAEKTWTGQLVIESTVIDPASGPETKTETYDAALQVTVTAST